MISRPMLHQLSIGTAEAARHVLDTFGVPQRLIHVRDFVWRGGEIGVRVERGADGEIGDVGYEVRATWAAAVFERSASQAGLVPRAQAAIEGRWLRGQVGYVLRVGIDLRIPTAMYVCSDHPLSSVPFRGRPQIQVEQALATDLAVYVEWFLDHCASVPEARAAATRRLSALEV